MKQLLPLVLLVFIAGCVGPVTQGCVEDNYCSMHEKYISGCSDCVPDFTVSYLDGYYHNGMLSITTCIDNWYGDYVGELSLYHEVMMDDMGVGSFDERYVYFDGAELDVWSSVNVHKQSFDLDLSVQEGQYPQSHCFWEEYNVGSAQEYTITMHVNYDESVQERDYSNNKMSIVVAGEFTSFPEYLIEESVGPFNYMYSDWYTTDYDSFEYPVYFAQYLAENYAGVQVHAIGDAGIVESILQNEIFVYEEWEFIEYEGSLLLYAANEYIHYYLWVSDGTILMIGFDPSESAPGDLVSAYLSRYPSTLVNPGLLLPDMCTLASGLTCEDFILTSANLDLQIGNQLGRDIIVYEIYANQRDYVESSDCVWLGESPLSAEEIGGYQLLCDSLVEVEGKYTFDLRIIYSHADSTAQFTHEAKGELFVSMS